MARKYLAAFASLIGICAAPTQGVLAAPDPQPVVHTESGDVAGLDQGQAVAFLGTPYAAAPTGDRRWRPPAPAPAWTGARPAAAFAHICPQPTPDRTGQSEDCLFLNV